MRNLILLLCLMVSVCLQGQATFVVGVTVESRSSELQDEIRDMLYNRVQRGLAKHGVGANGSATLSVMATVDEGELTMTATAPVRYMRTYYVELQLTNKLGGEVFATYNEDVTVAKRSEKEGIRSAISQLALRGERFQEFVGKAKTEISAYYQENCAAVMARAEQQLAARDFLNGLQTLAGVPGAAESCSSQATARLQEAYTEYETVACDRQVGYAEALVANEQFDLAVLQLLTIPNPSRCQDRFTAVTTRLQEVKQRLRQDAMERLLLLYQMESDRTERQRRFLENIAFVQSRPCCSSVNEQGRIIIID